MLTGRKILILLPQNAVCSVYILRQWFIVSLARLRLLLPWNIPGISLRDKSYFPSSSVPYFQSVRRVSDSFDLSSPT